MIAKAYRHNRSKENFGGFCTCKACDHYFGGCDAAKCTCCAEMAQVSDHLAIMKAEWGLLPKVLSGQKTVESRWAKNRPPYWNKIKPGDVVYFKDSGQPVTAKATVAKVARHTIAGGLAEVRALLNYYASLDGIEPRDVEAFAQLFKEKRFVIFVYLRDPKAVPPFLIDKTGYGNQVAWITVDSIEQLRGGRKAIQAQGALVP